MGRCIPSRHQRQQLHCVQVRHSDPQTRDCSMGSRGVAAGRPFSAVDLHDADPVKYVGQDELHRRHAHAFDCPHSRKVSVGRQQESARPSWG